jgi:hypothetical protein
MVFSTDMDTFGRKHHEASDAPAASKVPAA